MNIPVGKHAVEVCLRNLEVCIQEKCSVHAAFADVLRMCSLAVLWWVTTPNNVHSLSVVCNLGFLKCHYFEKLRWPTR